MHLVTLRERGRPSKGWSAAPRGPQDSSPAERVVRAFARETAPGTLRRALRLGVGDRVNLGRRVTRGQQRLRERRHRDAICGGVAVTIRSARTTKAIDVLTHIEMLQAPDGERTDV